MISEFIPSVNYAAVLTLLLSPGLYARCTIYESR